MRSMTGFGAATRAREGFSASAEVRSVNNRYLKIGVRASSVLSSREHEIEDLVRRRIARGTVNVSVRVIRRERPVVIHMNEAAVEEYLKLLSRLSEEAGVAQKPDLALLAGLPGVFSAEEIEEELPDEEWAAVREVVDEALHRMTAMREREGAHLAAEFAERSDAAAALVARIAERAPRAAPEQIARMEERVTRLLAARGVEVKESDLLRELGILAERGDVTEEVTRLRSHVAQFRQALSETDAVGRRLEFLVQEMAREANTISAKASDVETSRLCVDLKVELDRLKEQVLNVE